jgi:ceramide glucosyltransferase
METIVWIFAVVCFGATFFKVIAGWQCWWYRHRTYPRLKKEMDPDYRPSVRVFLPCKDIEEGLDANLDAIAAQDYPDFKLVCVTESEDDAAVAAIEAARRRHPGRIERVVAGLATVCGQKNHNLLAAIDAHGDAEVYLFCDAKVRPSPDWIARMVEPFSVQSRRVLAVSAMTTSSVCSDHRLPHMLQQQMAVWQSVAQTAFAGGVWGASMAFRRTDFEELGLRRIWSETIVDDMTALSRLLAAGGRGCMVAALDAHPNASYRIRSLTQAFEWAVRQTVYVRYCVPRCWVPLLIANTSGIACLCWPVPLLAAPPGTASHLFGLLCLCLAVPAVATNLLVMRPSGTRLPWPRFVALALFWDVILLAVTVSAMLEDGLSWRGIRYDVGRRGRVLSISRGETSLVPAPIEAPEPEEEATSPKTAKVTA